MTQVPSLRHSFKAERARARAYVRA